MTTKCFQKRRFTSPVPLPPVAASPSPTGLLPLPCMPTVHSKTNACTEELGLIHLGGASGDSSKHPKCSGRSCAMQVPTSQQSVCAQKRTLASFLPFSPFSPGKMLTIYNKLFDFWDLVQYPATFWDLVCYRIELNSQSQGPSGKYHYHQRDMILRKVEDAWNSCFQTVADEAWVSILATANCDDSQILDNFQPSSYDSEVFCSIPIPHS